MSTHHTVRRFIVGMVFAVIGMAASLGAAAATSPEVVWTDEQFPSYIRRLNYFGERPDWSHDGKRILFVGRSFGDVYEMEVATGKVLPVTHHYYHGGYLRATYLSNGDILLLGPRMFDPTNWREGRFKNMEMWVLDKNCDKPAVPLGELLWEGAAASRTQLRISWARYPDEHGFRQLMVGDIDYASGQPRVVNARVVLDNANEVVKGTTLEPQNFIPGRENHLIVQVGAWPRPDMKGAEVFELNLTTGELVNHSQLPLSYDEPEGIFPDGKYTLVESAQHDTNPATRGGTSCIDLYKLSLDGKRTWERMTYFTAHRAFKASNPVVSDDGRFIAFMVARSNEVAGIGHGIYLLDIAGYERAKGAQQ